MAATHSQLLADLRAFVRDEQEAGNRKLLDVWNRALPDKLDKGWTQAFIKLERAEDAGMIWACPDPEANESRFREGDLLLLHTGNPLNGLLGRRLALEAEEDGRWLLSGTQSSAAMSGYSGGACYADPDAMDLSSYYERALQELADSPIGQQTILPLLTGRLEITFDDRDIAHAEGVARGLGFDDAQAHAVGMAYGAEQVACIQGPPGTGKTRVLALIAKLLTQRGERVLVTSHTHMAINNALNSIHAFGVPAVKVSHLTQRKGLHEQLPCFAGLGAWAERPTNGYVVGATPFATCTQRLQGYAFETVLFDEASQVTLPLALMAMRTGKRFIFIGDHQQLPPVLLSQSVLDATSPSVFTAFTSRQALHNTMLKCTYRMNRWLADWPSRIHYDGLLVATGPNRERRLTLSTVPARLAPVFDPAACGVFIPTLDRSARTRNFRDAELVAALCAAAADGGVPLAQIGIVTPYRAQGRAVRSLLIRRFGRVAARRVVADTVERMQGQERELIIVSLATGDEVFLQAIASFFFQPQRLNVAITRAISKLILIGPELAAVPDLEHRTVRQWIAQYRDLVGQMKRVEL
jgi:DNA replication ATP-dependent helicase Dna2